MRIAAWFLSCRIFGCKNDRLTATVNMIAHRSRRSRIGAGKTNQTPLAEADAIADSRRTADSLVLNRGALGAKAPAPPKADALRPAPGIRIEALTRHQPTEKHDADHDDS